MTRRRTLQFPSVRGPGLESPVYWSRRAERPGLPAVMWRSAAFNRCVDQRQRDLLGRLLGSVRGRRILDLGCGTGRISFFLADAGAEVTGLDFSPAMIARAERERAHRPAPRGSVRFVTGTVPDLRPAERFDWVVSVACLCFTGEGAFRETVRSVCAVLREDGRILLMEPIHRCWPVRRVCPFPLDEWLAEFGRHGFVAADRDRMIFLPGRLLGLLPLPERVTAFLFRLGERVLRLPGLGHLLSDYKVLLLERASRGGTRPVA